MSQSSTLMPLHVQYDFYPYQGYLCAFALLFSKPPPQRNYLPDTVPGFVSRNHKLDLSNLTSGIPLTSRLASRTPAYPRLLKEINQCQVVVKLHGVFLSCSQQAASSQPFQFRRINGQDSCQVVTPFMRVETYSTRYFAQINVNS